MGDRVPEFDALRLEALRRDWLSVADLAVWAPLHSSRLGALPRLRKRVLELGEKLAALGAAREWIPQPRERMKIALASALAANEALQRLESELAELDPGTARDALAGAIAALGSSACKPLEEYADRCARLLDSAARTRE